MTRLFSFLVLIVTLLLGGSAPVAAQGSLLSSASRPTAVVSANTAIPANARILWRNATEIYTMDAAGGNLTQLTPTLPANLLSKFSTLDHVAASPQRGHLAISYLDTADANHCGLYDLANDTYTPLVPYFESCGYGGIDWDLNGYIYFAGRERAPYALDTVVLAEAQANAAAFDIWRIKYDGTGLQKIISTTTHGEADVSVSENGSLIAWASSRIVEGYAEIWVAPTNGDTSAMAYQSTDTTRTVHDPELSPDGTQVAFSKRDPDQPLQFGIRPHEIFKCSVTNCTATLAQVSAVGNGPICILPDWMVVDGVEKIVFHELEDDGTPYQGPTLINPDGTGAVRLLHGPSAPKFIETDAVPPLPAPEGPSSTVPANLLVRMPSFGVHGNAANDGGIVTEAAYLGNASGKVTAVTKANNLGTDHHDLTIKWSTIEATVGNYTWTRIDEVANNSTQPLILNIAPIWDDGAKTVPADIAGVAWESASMSNAYNNMLTALRARYPSRVWQIGVGNEADVYLGANPAQVANYATFLSNIRPHARTTFGVNPFALTMSFRFSAVPVLLTTYAAPVNQLDFPSITYYATATADTTALAAQISSDLQSVQVAIGGGRRWFLAEVGMTTDSPSSESVQQVALYVAVTTVSHMATQFQMPGFTWYQLSDVSAEVRTSFGATSYGERASVGIRDLSNAAKDIEPVVAGIFGGVTETPPPPPDPQLPGDPVPLSPGDGVTLNNPVDITWSDEDNVTFTLLLGPIGSAPTQIPMAGAAQYLFTGVQGTTYQWSVQACNVVGCKNQTVAERTFTIAPPPLPAPTNLAISAPADGATGVSLNPTLSWSATNATSYVLRFGTANPPTTVVYSGSLPQFTVSAAVNNQLYRWSIDAINTSGTITASGSFTTEAAAGVATHPKLWITAARQTAWDAMRADYVEDTTCVSQATENEKLGCKLYKQLVDKTSLATPAEDLGLEDAIRSRVAGENAATRCARAYTAFDLGFISRPNPINVNVSREHATDYPSVYDLCYDQWTQPQRDAALARLNSYFNYIITIRGIDQWNSSGSWYCSDVDQPIGEYMGFMEFYFSTRDYNPTVVDLLNNWPHIGGLTPTTPYRCFPDARATVGRTARNMIKQYYEQAAGGAWPEGTEYATSAFLGLYGCEALRPIAEAAPICVEVDAYLDAWAQYLTHSVTRDSLYQHSAGDDQFGHTLWDDSFPIIGMRMMLALTGALPDNATRAALYKVLLNVRAALPAAYGIPYQGFAGRSTIMANPYITAAADLSGLPKCHRSAGFGWYIWNDGTLTTDSQFVASLRPAQRGMDHLIQYFGHFNLYRRSQYAVTNPVSYAGPSAYPEGVNSTLVEGLTAPTFGGIPYKAETGYTCGSDYLYVSGTTGGSHYPAGTASAYDPASANFYTPARHVHEWTDSFVYLPSATKTYDTIVRLTRINAVDPTSFPGWNTPGGSKSWASFSGSTGCYNELTCMDIKETAKVTRILARPRWTRFQHQWYDPTVAGNVTSWTLPDGQVVTDTWLAPDAVTIVKQATSTLAGFKDSTVVVASERKWRTTTEPTSNVQWNCLFNVVNARNSGAAAPTLTELTVTNNGAGVLITRPGNDDRVVVGNCAQGPSIIPDYPTTADATAVLPTARYRAAGAFAFTYQQTTATAKVLLTDLNPALTCAYTVNEGASTPITEDSGGFEELSLATAEEKRLVITCS